MKPDHRNGSTNRELDASLERLGVREVEERLEVSPLLMAGEPAVGADGGTVCCSCKFPPEVLEDGSLPYPEMDPGPTGNVDLPLGP